MVVINFLVVLFFQAEDGIRDGHVTGVQTCALPISAGSYTLKIMPSTNTATVNVPVDYEYPTYQRSEERRVGKECWCGDPPCHYCKGSRALWIEQWLLVHWGRPYWCVAK